MNLEHQRLEPWEEILPSFRFHRDQAFCDMLVPTTDTVRYGYLMQRLLSVRRSVLFTGLTGVGKVSRGAPWAGRAFTLKISSLPALLRIEQLKHTSVTLLGGI